MRNLCGFCKFHVCGKEEEKACICTQKGQEIEHWYVACYTQFRDRREHTVAWTGRERRRHVRMMATV